MRHLITAICMTLLAACAQPVVPAGEMPSPQVTIADIEAAREKSGIKDAVTDLGKRLAEVCHVAPLLPPVLPELADSGFMPSATSSVAPDFLMIEDSQDCVRSRVVSAFDAAAGESHCANEGHLNKFIDCIVNGQFLLMVANNLGGIGLTPQSQWADRDLAWRQINDTLFTKFVRECQRRSQWEANYSAEDIMMGYLEIDRSHISKCPTGTMRGSCITGAAVARFVRGRLPYIF